MGFVVRYTGRKLKDRAERDYVAGIPPLVHHKYKTFALVATRLLNTQLSFQLLISRPDFLRTSSLDGMRRRAERPFHQDFFRRGASSQCARTFFALCPEKRGGDSCKPKKNDAPSLSPFSICSKIHCRRRLKGGRALEI